MKPLSFQRKPKPVPAMAGPKYVPEKFKRYEPDLAMQEAIRRSERQPRLISMNARPEVKRK